MAKRELVAVRPKGLNVDLPAESVGPEEWTFAKNALFFGDVAIAQPGALPVYGTPLFRPIAGAFVPGAVPYVVYAGAAALGATDGLTHANVTPAQGWTIGACGDASGGIFNGIPILNDGAHAPISWVKALGSPFVPFTAWPAGQLAQVVRPFKYQILAANLAGPINDPLGVMWSVSAAPGAMPGSWAPLATNDAGSVTLAGGQGQILDIAPVRDAAMIFEGAAVWLLQPIGGAFIFSTRRVLQAVGLLCRGAWAALDTQCIFLADGDIVLTDGQTTRSLLNRRMRKAVFGGISSNAARNSFVVRSTFRQEILIGFPEGADAFARRAVVWNYAEDKIGIIDLPEYAHAFAGVLATGGDTWDAGAAGSWDSETRIWSWASFNPRDAYLIGVRPQHGASGRFEALWQAQAPDDGPLEVILEKSMMPLGGSDRKKMVTRLRPKMEGQVGTLIKWAVGMADSPGQAIAWGPEVDYFIGQSERVDVRQAGRLVSVRARSQALTSWKCAGFDVEFQDAGAR
jgi:hypothetical protein